MVSQKDIKCFVSHIKLYNLLHNQDSWTREEQSPNGSLAKKIKKLKQNLLECFPRDEGFNWRTPKFEALDAWPRLILFLGPPAFQSTETYEASHQPNKRKGNLTNCKNIERDILALRTRQILYTHHQVFFNDNEKMRWYELQQSLQTASRDVNASRTCFGRQALEALGSSDKNLMKHTAELLGIKVPKPVRIFTCSGVTDEATRLRLKDCFKLTSPLANGDFYARLHAVYDLEGPEKTKLVPWLKIELYEPTGDKDGIQNLVVKSNGKCLIPLGHGYKIEQRVQLCSIGKLVIVNKYCVSIVNEN